MDSDNKPTLTFGDGEYSCAACGLGMTAPCEHWNEFLARPAAPVSDNKHSNGCKVPTDKPWGCYADCKCWCHRTKVANTVSAPTNEVSAAEVFDRRVAESRGGDYVLFSKYDAAKKEMQDKIDKLEAELERQDAFWQGRFADAAIRWGNAESELATYKASLPERAKAASDKVCEYLLAGEDFAPVRDLILAEMTREKE